MMPNQVLGVTEPMFRLQNKHESDRFATAKKTVKGHRASVVKKMNARSVADLVRIAENARSHSLTAK